MQKLNSTEQILIDLYGPLLSLEQLATVLKRSKDGLRLTIRGSSEFATAIQSCRVRLGRRVYFNSLQIAKLMIGGEKETMEARHD